MRAGVRAISARRAFHDVGIHVTLMLCLVQTCHVMLLLPFHRIDRISFEPSDMDHVIHLGMFSSLGILEASPGSAGRVLATLSTSAIHSQEFTVDS